MSTEGEARLRRDRLVHGGGGGETHVQNNSFDVGTKHLNVVRACNPLDKTIKLLCVHVILWCKNVTSCPLMVRS